MVSSALNNNDVYTPEEMMALIRAAWGGVPNIGKVTVKELTAVHDFHTVFHHEQPGVTRKFYGLGSVSTKVAKEVKRCLHNFRFCLESGQPVVYSKEFMSERLSPQWTGDKDGRGWPLFKEGSDVVDLVPTLLEPSILPNYKDVQSKMSNVISQWKRQLNAMLGLPSSEEHRKM